MGQESAGGAAFWPQSTAAAVQPCLFVKSSFVIECRWISYIVDRSSRHTVLQFLVGAQHCIAPFSGAWLASTDTLPTLTSTHAVFFVQVAGFDVVTFNHNEHKEASINFSPAPALVFAILVFRHNHTC